MRLITALWIALRASLTSRAVLIAENLALRHQLSILQVPAKRPQLRPLDRLFWVWLSHLWPNWHSALNLFKPDTVTKWHRQGFKLYWRWLSKPRKGGRPPIDKEIRDLIRRMSYDNPRWGAPRILSELLLLGYTVSETTVANYMPKTRKPPSQTWRTFLANHVPDIAAIDFFTVPTLTFGVLYVFVVFAMSNARWSILTSPNTRPPSGRLSRSWKPFRLTKRPGTSFEIGTTSTVRTFNSASRTWVSKTC